MLSFLIILSLSFFASADYPDYSANFLNYGAEVKYEDGEEKKFRPSDLDRQREIMGGAGSGGHKNPFAQPQHHEDGEYDDPYQ